MRRLLCSILLSMLFGSVLAAERPRLVVQITVGGMRYDYLLRFGANYSDRGFQRIITQGALCERASIGYLNTNTAAGLATSVTGTNPSSHGVIGSGWFNYTTGDKVSLTHDKTVHTVGADELDAQVSPRTMIASTTGDCIKGSSPRSKVISIAFAPLSAVIAGGFEADGAYWVSPRDGKMVTSTYYNTRLPEWVEKFNATNLAEAYSATRWDISRPRDAYFNVLRKDIAVDTALINFDFLTRKKYDYPRLATSPGGNALIKDFATQAIIYEELGKDDGSTDFLSIVFDGTRAIGEKYGANSMEVEDAFYRLDSEIAAFLDFLIAQVGQEHLLVVLTSDHGLSDPYNEGGRAVGGRFDAAQFSVLINGFLGAQLTHRIPQNRAAELEGDPRWVLDFSDNQIYLNRKRIYAAGLDLAEIQQLVADFAIQFRGVANAITARNLQATYFAQGTMGKAQQGYFARHSGDVVLNLLPGWTLDGAKVSQSGSQYVYDSHIPIAFFGGGVAPKRIAREVSLTDIAPTIAHMVGVTPPNAATGIPITEIYAQ